MSEGTGFVLRTVAVVGQGAACGRTSRSPLHAISRQVLTARDVPAGLELIQQAEPDLVIISEGVPVSEALGLVQSLRSSRPDLPVIVVSAQADVELAVQFVRAGAYDFIEGPLVGDRLERVVAAAEAAGASKKKDRFFTPECPAGLALVGHSPRMVKTMATIRLVALSRCNPVLILGETGTGKELAAQAIHALRSGPKEKFVAVNCAALTANLMESELFGHVKGAFTGADREKTGLFELAGSGTVFLDEISELPLELQPKLLRVLQERSFRKVGGTKDIRCDATIIASSNRDLFQEAGKGAFRKDLYYRLAVFPITVPPLRCQQRRSDIPLLAQYFIETSNISAGNDVDGLSAAAEEELMRHDWPGNVRELKNVVDRALILEKTNEITVSSLIIEREGEPAGDSPAGQETLAEKPASRRDFSLEAAEREFILRALKETGWQRTRAAALLGISRATLHAKLNRYDIKAPGGQTPKRGASSPARGKGELEGVTA